MCAELLLSVAGHVFFPFPLAGQEFSASAKSAIFIMKRKKYRETKDEHTYVYFEHTHIHNVGLTLSADPAHIKNLFFRKRGRGKKLIQVSFSISPPSSFLVFVSLCIVIHHIQKSTPPIYRRPLLGFFVCVPFSWIFFMRFITWQQSAKRGAAGARTYLSLPFFFSYSFHFWKKLVLKTRRPLLDYWST